MSQQSTVSASTALPQLPLQAWERSKKTLHLYLQIVGKVRLQLAPRKNHWWNVTLYLSPKGLTTGPTPTGDGYNSFEITFNFLEHRLELVVSDGFTKSFELRDGLSVAQFYEKLHTALGEAGLNVSILDRPFDVPGITEPFSTLTDITSYQKEYVQRFWRILLWVHGVFNEFSGRFYGKTCPVHLYWHHMDLAVTRFSGKKGPAVPADRGLVEKDAYSHEVVSFGFWAGDDQVRQPAFYAYCYPSPDGLGRTPLAPEGAQWIENNGSPTATLFYDELRKESDPRAALLEFLESAYQAAARLAGWDVEELSVPALGEL
jgi:hypothetical protein